MDNRKNMEVTRTTEFDESRRRFLLNTALAGAGLMAAPLLMPQAAEAALFATPSSQDQIKLGQQAAEKIKQQYREVTDGRARHFNEIGRRLVAALPFQDRQTWNFNFHVLDSKDVNAFALPGGPMFMFTGLYEKLTTDDALAGVTGHEMTHVRKQHWAKAYAKSEERQAGVGIIGAILGASGVLRSQSSQSIFNVLGSGFDVLTGQKFSRNEEAEADTGGLDNMVAAGYNPQGMILLFQTLERVAGNSSTPAFLSDHPLTSERIKAAQQRIAELSRQRSFPPLTSFNYSALR